MGYDDYIQEVPGDRPNEIFLYALSTCPWCKKAKALLQELGLGYRYVDVDMLEGNARESATEDMKACSTSLAFPTIQVNSDYCIIGFNEVDIKELMDKR